MTRQVYFDDWEGEDQDVLIRMFEISEATLAGCDILFAAYENGGYDGSAFVLFRKDGQLFEVHGSHCSCHGLEDQWVPEEVTEEALRRRMETATYGIVHRFKDAIAERLTPELPPTAPDLARPVRRALDIN